MNLKELDEMAYKMQPLPTGLKMPETYYYLTVRALYAMFLSGKITAGQAAKEKQQVRQTYRDFELVNRIGEHDMAVLRNIQHSKDYYDQNGCPVCKQLAAQISGLAPRAYRGHCKGR